MEPMASAAQPAGSVIRPTAFQHDAALVGAAVAGDQASARRLFERYGPYVRRIAARLLGMSPDVVADCVHDVFVQVFRNLHKLDKPESLKPWIASVTVNVARKRIRSARRQRWLRFVSPERVPDIAAPASNEATEALRATYAVLDEIPADERVAFALRFIEGMQLTEMADACDVSLATIKRRLQRAEQRFVEVARSHPELQPWIEGGSRWGGQP
jgi:RNA polymerase sigma-70 factor (ECF subfamily)